MLTRGAFWASIGLLGCYRARTAALASTIFAGPGVDEIHPFSGVRGVAAPGPAETILADDGGRRFSRPEVSILNRIAWDIDPSRQSWESTRDRLGEVVRIRMAGGMTFATALGIDVTELRQVIDLIGRRDASDRG